MTSEQIRLGVITEVHIVPPGTPPGFWHNPFLFDQAEALFLRAVQRCVELGVDAITILGDLTHFADAGSFAAIRRVLETTELPVYVLPGNHDLDASPRPLGAFQQALALPNVTIAPANLALSPEIDLSLVGLEPGGGDWKYSGVLSRAVTGNEPKLHLVLTHFPSFAMKEMLAGAELKHAGDLGNRAAVLERIEAIPGPVLIVNGHLHVHASIAEGRVLQLSVAALIEPPHDVTLLTVGIDEAGGPWVSRQASGLFETPGVRLPVLSAREERWQVVDGGWQPA
ncbi:MAG TPA: metallophosphoesterase [Thermomicrobiales bacterium]|nr:metallophosphoesterase [Thermomicrobiales bacterium]